MMKTTRYATRYAGLLLGLLLLGCAKDDAPAPTMITFDVVDSVLYPGAQLGLGQGPPYYLNTRQVYAQFNQASLSSGTQLEQVHTATLSEVELQLTSNYAAQNLDMVRTVTIYLISAQGGRSVLAQTTTVPTGTTRLQLGHNGLSMLDQLRAGSYYVSAAFELQPGAQLVGDLQLRVRYAVEARKP